MVPLTEIALIQRLTVLLSHPIYALGILLFTIIASTGIGSALSDRIPLTRTPWLYLYPLLTAGSLVALSVVLDVLLARMVTATIPARIVASILVIFPVGLLLGLFVPVGMRLAASMMSPGTRATGSRAPSCSRATVTGRSAPSATTRILGPAFPN